MSSVVKVIAATAATSLVIAGIFFLLFQKFVLHQCRRKNKTNTDSHGEEAMVTHEEFQKLGENVKGLIVDENGQDVLYLRKLEGAQPKTNLTKVIFNPSYGEEMSKSIPQKAPFLPEPSVVIALETVAKPLTLSTQVSAPLEQPPPQHPHPTPQQVIPMKQTSAPQPPPSPPLTKKILMPLPPPPPPVPAKRNPAPPYQPPKAGTLVTSMKPPPAPRLRGKANSKSRIEVSIESSKGAGIGHMKLKPLHWDKVMANVDHSMVWDEIKDGSLRFEDDLIETLFGYGTANLKSPERSNTLSRSNNSNSSVPAQVFILEPRKSQNTAIVLKSLAVSRKEILDALLDGQGLATETLEKLTKISPTQEEEAKILQFNGIPTQLADAESFLYDILKVVPSAFTRFRAMLFRSNYDPEILHLKESLQTLELACKELRDRGLFLKLLEAILKAGNRMNAGTARGNAQGFNLSALRNLSDVKSTDGKTTLLHFVVEQVVRSEGRRCVINRNHILGRSNSERSTNSDPNSDSLTAEKRDSEYLMLGLPVLGGLSNQLSNVKKAASIGYDSFIDTCSILSAWVTEIRQLVTGCGNDERGGFVREMKGFLEECEEELKVMREEETKVMDLVKRTTQYYQAGVSKDKWPHPLQLFVIVKDFLDMVDRVCIDITQKLQKRNKTTAGSSSPPSLPTRAPERFLNFQAQFMSDASRTTSSESDDDF